MENKRDRGLRICIRVSAEELDRINKDAEDQGLSRSDYIRACLKPSPTLKDAENLSRLADTLRQLQVVQSAYIQTLDRMLDLAEEQGGGSRVDELRSIAVGEQQRAAELMELLFRAERRCVGLLRKLKRDIRG